MLLNFVFFFFFKQKTAYEMRISDWSSDVCSSDLRLSTGRRRGARGCCWWTIRIGWPATWRRRRKRSPRCWQGCDADARSPRCRRCSCEIRANIAPTRSIRKANPMKFFASCNKGLEYLLADELLALGCARATATMAGVNVEGTLEDAQRAVLWSRLASRVLWPLAEFPCEDEHALYRGVAVLPWREHMDETMTLAVDAHVSGDAITHARYAAQRVKDRSEEHTSEAPARKRPVDNDAPALRLNLVVRKGDRKSVV